MDSSPPPVRTSLTRADCLGLLGEQSLARVVLSVRCLPAALPVRVGLIDDRHLMFASSEETVLIAARRGDVLSIQIDGLEPSGATWSVLASGIAERAPSEPPQTHPQQEAVLRGAALFVLPISVVVGERIN